jgi:DNA repair exonuclease SbcCD nuclease subunit
LTRILLIPDMHVGHGDKLKRLDQLKNYIYDEPELPSAIVQIGDLFDFESLCVHDQYTANWTQRSVQRDMDAGMLALDHLDNFAKDLGVPFHFLGGNHEDRYDRWMQSDVRLASSPFPHTMAEVMEPFDNINYHPFGQVLELQGASFVHYFVSGVMNRPHSGERPALSMLRTHHKTVIAGHKHTFDFAEHTRPDGTKLFALVAGCFVDPKKSFGYAGQGRKLWWNGCQLLDFYRPGEFDLHTISINRLAKY